MLRKLNILPLAATATAALVLLPGVAAAHTGHSGTMDLTAGLLHPFGGLDHILAMISVGALGVAIGGRAIWFAPLAFLAAMAAGGLAGTSGIDLPLLEAGLFASVIVLGGMLIRRVRPPAGIVFGLISLFGTLHGFAHGAEMPGNAAGPGYAAGFLGASALLHFSGICGALCTGRLMAFRAVPAGEPR